MQQSERCLWMLARGCGIVNQSGVATPPRAARGEVVVLKAARAPTTQVKYEHVVKNLHEALGIEKVYEKFRTEPTQNRAIQSWEGSGINSCTAVLGGVPSAH